METELSERDNLAKVLNLTTIKLGNIFLWQFLKKKSKILTMIMLVTFFSLFILKNFYPDHFLPYIGALRINFIQ